MYKGNECEIIGNPIDVNCMKDIKKYAEMDVYEKVKCVCLNFKYGCILQQGLSNDQLEYVKEIIVDSGEIEDINVLDEYKDDDGVVYDRSIDEEKELLDQQQIISNRIRKKVALNISYVMYNKLNSTFGGVKESEN